MVHIYVCMLTGCVYSARVGARSSR